jgi:hypothetical protein
MLWKLDRLRQVLEKVAPTHRPAEAVTADAMTVTASLSFACAAGKAWSR